MRRGRFQRRIKHIKLGLRRIGKVRIALLVCVFTAAVVLHYEVATHFVPEQPDDGKLYVQLAKNLIENGVFSSDKQTPFNPTLIRLPGYPLFLAAVYLLFGDGNEMAVRVVQGAAYSLTCISVALIVFNWLSGIQRQFRGGLLAFIFAAFCPFMAIYAATLLTETLTMCLLAAALLAATYALKARKFRRAATWWFVCGVLGGLNVYLRPDAGLFAFGIGLTLVVSVFWGREKFFDRIIDRVKEGFIFTGAFVLILVPWTVRNERVFGVFQPLAPAHAEMPGEFVPRGYYLWLRTWIDDSKYIGPMLWDLEIKPINIEDVPATAFSSDEEKSHVVELLDQYNNSDPDKPSDVSKITDDSVSEDSGDDDSPESADEKDANSDNSNPPPDTEWNLKIAPEVDAGFAQIAHDRIANAPWRFYVGLPAKRAASMWFDTHSDYWPFAGELFPLKDIDERYYQHIWLPLFAGLTLVYTLLAVIGMLLLLLSKDRWSLTWFLLILFVSVPRIIFFGTLENPEPRYLVELFIPAAILAGLVIARLRWRREPDTVGLELFYGNE